MEPELIQRVLKGEKNLFEALVKQYHRGVFSLCFRVFHEASLAEDLAQETFIRAYTKLATYKPEYKFSSWLLKIATNLCRDHLRKPHRDDYSLEKFNEEGSLDALLSQSQFLDSTEDVVLQGMEQKEQRGALAQALNNLPDKLRLLLILRFEKFLSYKDLADQFEVNVNNIKIMIFRAKARLKTELENLKKV